MANSSTKHHYDHFKNPTKLKRVDILVEDINDKAVRDIINKAIPPTSTTKELIAILEGSCAGNPKSMPRGYDQFMEGAELLDNKDHTIAYFSRFVTKVTPNPTLIIDETPIPIKDVQAHIKAALARGEEST